MISKRKLIKEALILVLMIGVINVVASYFHWYWSIWWFDMPVHFMGGVFVAMLTIYILYKRIGVSMASKQNLKVSTSSPNSHNPNCKAVFFIGGQCPTGCLFDRCHAVSYARCPSTV